MATEPSMDL